MTVEFVKTDKLKVVMGLSEYRGVQSFDLRLYAFTNGEWKPTPKGFNIEPDKLDAFVESVLEAVNEAKGHKKSVQYYCRLVQDGVKKNSRKFTDRDEFDAYCAKLDKRGVTYTKHKK